MRFYNVVRFGAYKIRYAEVGRTHWERPMPQEVFDAYTTEILTVPQPVQKTIDPFLLWKQTERRDTILSLEIQDKAGNTWFEMKSTQPLSKILEISNAMQKEMY
jgi:hypothetical protein